MGTPGGHASTSTRDGTLGLPVGSHVGKQDGQATTGSMSAALGVPVGVSVGTQARPASTTGTAATVPIPCKDTGGRTRARQGKRKSPPPDGVMGPHPPPKLNFGMLPSPQRQMSAPTEEWRHGIEVDCGPDWTWDVIDAAVARGPHPTACTPKGIALFEEDIEYQRRAGFCKVIPWEELKRRQPSNLKISPVAAVPQVGRRPRIILDLSFLVYQDVNVVITATQASVNNTTALRAPKEAVREIGKVLPRLLTYMRDTPAGLHILCQNWISATGSGDSLCGTQTVSTLHMCFPNGRANNAELLFRRRCKWDGWRARPYSALSPKLRATWHSNLWMQPYRCPNTRSNHQQPLKRSP